MRGFPEVFCLWVCLSLVSSCLYTCVRHVYRQYLVRRPSGMCRGERLLRHVRTPESERACLYRGFPLLRSVGFSLSLSLESRFTLFLAKVVYILSFFFATLAKVVY